MNRLIAKGRVLCAALVLFALTLAVIAGPNSKALAQAVPTLIPSPVATSTMFQPTAPPATTVPFQPTTPPATTVPTTAPFQPTTPPATTVPTTAPFQPTTPPATTAPFQPTAPPPYPVPTQTTTMVPAYATSVPSMLPTSVPTIIPGTPPPADEFPAAVAGCQFFPAGDVVYNKPTYDQPADPDSDAIMQAFLAVAQHSGSSAGNLVATGNITGWPVNFADSTTPSYPLTNSSTGLVVVNGTTPLAPFPFLSTYGWEIKGSTITGDRHIMILNRSNCYLYESFVSTVEPPYAWQVVNNQLQQKAYYGQVWDLTKPYPIASAIRNGVNAGKMPHYVGMVRIQDIQDGCVCHMLNMDVVAHSLRSSAHVWPAISSEGANYYTGPAANAPYAPPIGTTFRLRQSYQPAPCPTGTPDNCNQAYLIISGLKNYGARIMDTGSFSGYIYLADDVDANGNATWPWITGDIKLLDQIPMSAFEVVAPPGCVSTATCIK